MRIGRPEWLGRCPIAAAFACAALLRDGLADVTYVTGRIFGSRQCWAEFTVDRLAWVLDISLSDAAFLKDRVRPLHSRRPSAAERQSKLWKP